MNAGIDIDRVRSLAEQTAEDNGLELYDVEVTHQRGRTILRVIVDRPSAHGEGEGVTVNECAALSRELSLLFDADDPVDFAYVLEVSSPGVERPLKERRHFVRAQGEKVLLVMGPEHEGKATYEGILEAAQENELTLRLPPKVKKTKKGQPRKEIPIEQWESVQIQTGHVVRAKTIYTFSES